MEATSLQTTDDKVLAWFTAVDTDGSGTIDAQELSLALKVCETVCQWTIWMFNKLEERRYV